jgi:hypothetical protein
MALRDKLRDRAQPSLEPGEQIQHIWMGQTGPSPYFALLSYWIMLFGAKYRIVAVTDRSTVVWSAGGMMPAKPKAILARGPRAPLSVTGSLWGKVQIGPETMWVHKRFHKDIEAASASMGQIQSGVPTSQVVS